MLSVSGLSAGYGLLPVLNGIDLTAAAGEVVGLLGRNGAGKTTTLRAIAGALAASSGSIRLGDTDVTRMPAYRRAREGIAHVPQGRGIFNRLTVHENLEVGTRAKKRRGGPGIPATSTTTFPILKERADQVAGTLSGGQQQMLAIGRALCGDPRVLLLDEPSEGIQPNIVQAIADLLPKVARDRRVAIVLVEQNLDLVLKAADRCLIVEKGRVVHEARPSELVDEVSSRTCLHFERRHGAGTEKGNERCIEIPSTDARFSRPAAPPRPSRSSACRRSCGPPMSSRSAFPSRSPDCRPSSARR